MDLKFDGLNPAVVVSTEAQRAIVAFTETEAISAANLNDLCAIVATSAARFFNSNRRGFMASPRQLFMAMTRVDEETKSVAELHLVGHYYPKYQGAPIVFVATEEALPLPDGYHEQRVIAEAKQIRV